MPTNSHIGFAGEAAVASEFSIRGYIVSLPTVDQGTDLFIENHGTGQTWRIQVKTALEKTTQPNYYQFTAKEAAIQSPTARATHFAFVMRISSQFKIFLLAQPVLENFVNNSGLGSYTAGSGTRTFTFIRNPTSGAIACSGTNMLPYSAITAWNPWPVI